MPRNSAVQRSRALAGACFSGNARSWAHEPSLLTLPRPNFHSKQDSDSVLLMRSSVVLKSTISNIFLGEGV